MSKPVIDILMATYNGNCYVAEQLASIQAQTLTSWRLLISDDCSIDGTLNTIQSVSAVDSRIQLVSEGTRFGGAKQNFMHLLSLSDAPYIMFSDQDDVWLSDKVEKTLSEMRLLEAKYGKESPLLVFADMAVVDEDLQLIATSFEQYSKFDPDRIKFSQLLSFNIMAGCTMMLNRPLANMCLSEVNVAKLAMHDWWIALAAAAFGHIGYVDAAVSLYRQHSSNEVGALRYSPIARARQAEAMKQRFDDTLEQAGEFERVFGDKLDSVSAACLSEYLMIRNEKTLHRGLGHLVVSGSMKPGLRKLGQIKMVYETIRARRR